MREVNARSIRDGIAGHFDGFGESEVEHFDGAVRTQFDVRRFRSR